MKLLKGFGWVNAELDKICRNVERRLQEDGNQFLMARPRYVTS